MSVCVRRWGGIVAVAFPLLVAVAAPVALGSSHSVIEPYVGSSWIAPICDPVWPEGIGGACIPLPAGATQVNVRIDDASGFEAAGRAVLRNASGPIDTYFFCVSEIADIPPGATHLQVNVQDTAIGAAIFCPGPTAATTGLITAAFS